ncbi:HupE/UreJ family protein [Biformimicrobium ophioploci]|uniref:HupE/UreJ family protein n=1 Tax=Biformimicrobium ophioploci TaxID=3036711 RepID=A0ABQ6LXG9_9GAMM|nr:HupE/UreJ family protein [Microbulbifer sp. NKW57]GMG86770.1 HupE/UreJ family protein [Microbulbifer sp. NKW57]
MKKLLYLLLGPLLLLSSQAIQAHEIKPAYLEINETGPGAYNVVWKMPIRGGIPAPMEPAFPQDCNAQGEKLAREVTGAILQSWRLLCSGSLAGREVRVEGLQHSMTDALARISLMELPVQTVRLTPKQHTFTVSAAPSVMEVISTYFILGVEHILLGIDHLLFVFALLLVVIGWRKLVATITAFTVAHSITLTAATLGVVSFPQAPVEAIIALSILFLAVEIVRAQRGQIGLSYRKPWLVAFSFGLLHGFGFAGALSEVGLPPTEIPLALLFFNVGVEAGQLAFVLGVVCLAFLVKGVSERYRQYARLATTYAIGSLAMFWTIERVASFYV